MNLPPYPIFPIVIGEKISLRQIEEVDIDDLIEISYYDAVQAKNIEEAIEMQTKINKNYMDGNSIHWGIADNKTNKILGTCGYYRGLNNAEGELGCVLLLQHRGSGYMTAAMRLAIDFGLQNIEFKRIWAITNQENKKAIQLLERLNFKKITELDNNDIEFELTKND